MTNISNHSLTDHLDTTLPASQTVIRHGGSGGFRHRLSRRPEAAIQSLLIKALNSCKWFPVSLMVSFPAVLTLFYLQPAILIFNFQCLQLWATWPSRHCFTYNPPHLYLICSESNCELPSHLNTILPTTHCTYIRFAIHPVVSCPAFSILLYLQPPYMYSAYSAFNGGLLRHLDIILPRTHYSYIQFSTFGRVKEAHTQN